MIALTRILVPTNLGEPSRAAVTYGVAFARQFDAQLILLRVLAPDDYDAAVEAQRVLDTVVGAAAADPDPAVVARRAAEEALGHLLSAGDAAALRVEHRLWRGEARDPGAEIASCARDAAVQLIVMGKHRIGVVEQMLAGSVTEKVVRQAPCPVLIVTRPEHEFVLPDDPGEAGED